MAQGDVLRHRHLGHEHEVLVDDGDPVVQGLPGIAQVDRLSGEPDAATVVGVDAGQDLHQRRLARSVLAHERMHLAGQQRQIDAEEDATPGEVLGDVAHLKERDGTLRGPHFVHGLA